jgi:hypothetical protein
MYQYVLVPIGTFEYVQFCLILSGCIGFQMLEHQCTYFDLLFCSLLDLLARLKVADLNKFILNLLINCLIHS